MSSVVVARCRSIHIPKARRENANKLLWITAVALAAALLSTSIAAYHPGIVGWRLNFGDGIWSRVYSTPIAACEEGFYDVPGHFPEGWYPEAFVWSGGDHGCAVRNPEDPPVGAARGYMFVYDANCADGQWMNRATGSCETP